MNFFKVFIMSFKNNMSNSVPQAIDTERKECLSGSENITDKYRTAIYGHPVVPCKKRDEYIKDTTEGVIRVAKKLRAKHKLFKGQHKSKSTQFTTCERIVFTGHTWQLWKNYDNVVEVCRNSPKLKSVVLLSCSSGKAYSRYTLACKKLSSKLFEEGSKGVEIIGFKNEVSAGNIEREELCDVSLDGKRSSVIFKGENIVRCMDGKIVS